MPRKGAAAADPGDADIGHGRWTREGVKSYLERRYSTRLLMSAILAASGLVAMLTSSILLGLGVTSMMVRYPIGIALSYVTFLVGVFVWLRLMGLRTNSGAKTDLVDVADAADISWSGGGSGGGGGGGFGLPRGGGAFDGGGANASFAQAEARMPLMGAASSGPGSTSKPGPSLGIDFGDVDGEAIVLLLLAVVLVAVVFATSGYLIWMGPDILAEAAFGALLAGGLARRTKKETAAGWIAGVVKKTWWPFAVVLVAALFLAGYAQKHYPAAHTLKQAFALAFQ